MATVQLQNPTEGRAYYNRRKADPDWTPVIEAAGFAVTKSRDATVAPRDPGRAGVRPAADRALLAPGGPDRDDRDTYQLGQIEVERYGGRLVAGTVSSIHGSARALTLQLDRIQFGLLAPGQEHPRRPVTSRSALAHPAVWVSHRRNARAPM